MKNLQTKILLCALVALSAMANATPQTLTIFHTNDIHGHFVPERAEWRDDKAFVGGITALEQKLGELRATHPYSLYLDAGDLMTGNPVCGIEYNHVRGGALLEMLNRLDITAQCVGNHEFDLGAEHVTEFINSANYPLLCANVVRKTDGNPIAPSTALVSLGELRIGIIGLVTDGLADVVSKKSIAPFDIHDDAATAQPLVDSLDKFCDLIILLTHVGVEGDSMLAQTVRGVDVIVGGHSHTRLKTPKIVNGVVIVQAGSYCKNLGVLELTVDADSVVSYSGKLIELTAQTSAPRTPLAKFCDSLDTVLQARYGQVIGELAEPWTRGYYETSGVGNWICDRLRDSTHCDLALVNAGGIRANWNPGPISMLNVLELLPFENSIVTFEASGKELRMFAAQQAAAHGLHEHGVVEMSGMQIQYALRVDSTTEAKNILVDGVALDDAKTYRVASIDFVAVSQADRYLGFTPHKLEATDRMLSDFITAVIQNSKTPLRADPAPRIAQIP
jgi:2',3'-cyclic-nucleotide 2'-phosphodiesterase (5'-nucleotidase family)